MNRKIFALLLILPVAVFAADRLTASNVADGGGKEKKISKTTTTTAIAAEATPAVEQLKQNEVVEQQITRPQAATASISLASPSQAEGNTAVLTTDEKTALIAGAMEDLQSAYDDELSNDKVTSFYPDNLEKELYKWLSNHVAQPLKAANPMQINVERSFSRCPSGYSISLETIAGKITNEGWLLGDQGCWDRPMGKFQYDVAAGTVNVHLGTTDAMVPLQEYLKLFKASYKEG